MRILVTFPGRAGDLLWALPTVRTIARYFDTPVDLVCAGEFASLVPLLQRQPYLASVRADLDWALTPEQPTPPVPGVEGPEWDRVYHLGYRGWPDRALPYATEARLLQHAWNEPDHPPLIDLATPWITGIAVDRDLRTDWIEGWTETHFELKVGLTWLLQRAIGDRLPFRSTAWGHNISTSGRWAQEVGVGGCTWEQAARWIVGTKVFLGDCSALHVLAVALGVPVVIVEPMEARLNPIFYPLGMDGPQVTIVRGLDGQPTVDARHTAETLQRVGRLQEEIHAHPI